MNPGPYKKTYLDINGNHITDLPVRPGETPEQYKDRQMRISHFQILKREKMKIMKEETFFVQVPDNEEGIWGFLKGDMTQVKTFVFTESETNFLM